VVVQEVRNYGLDGPTPDRHLLRCDPDVLDPYVVAGFLRSGEPAPGRHRDWNIPVRRAPCLDPPATSR
jgi:hypothetical protein